MAHIESKAAKSNQVRAPNGLGGRYALIFLGNLRFFVAIPDVKDVCRDAREISRPISSETGMVRWSAARPPGAAPQPHRWAGPNSRAPPGYRR